MDSFRDICQTKSQQICYLSLSGVLQAAMFIYSVIIAGVGFHMLLVVTDNIGPILTESAEHLSIGMSFELISGFIVAIGLCNGFVCIGYPGFVYSILNVEKCKLHRKKIMSFALLQGILSVGILTIGVLSLLQRNHFDGNLETALINTMLYYRSRMDLKTSIDKMQIYYQCCGSGSLSDWFEIEWYRKKIPEQDSENTAPFSCCNRFTMSPCLAKSDTALLKVVRESSLKDIWYEQGCAEAVNSGLSKSLLFPVGIISIIFFFIQMFGTCLSYLILMLMNELKPKGKFQKLHFDMENFDHYNCDLDQLACESCSSGDECQTFRRVAQATQRYNHLSPLIKAKENQEKKTPEKARKQPYNRKEKDHKANKKESKSSKKEEKGRVKNADDTSVIDCPVIIPLIDKEYELGDGKVNVNVTDNTERQAGLASNVAVSEDIAKDYDIVSQDKKMEDTGTRLDDENKSETAASGPAAPVATYPLESDSVERFVINEGLNNELLYKERDSISPLSIDGT